MASALPDNQVEELASGMQSCRIDDNEKNMIETRLKLLDIPFNWNPLQSRPGGDNPQSVARDFKRKLKEMLENDPEIKFKSFCCLLTLAQELIKYDTNSALEKILECEPWIVSLKNGTCTENEFISINEAMEYIYFGSKAFALFKCGSVAEAKELLQKIPDVTIMEDKQRSGIYGVKAWVFMEYGVPGFLKALECISIARTKHSTMAEWHFLTGKIMSRIRHVKFPFMVVSDEEENFYRTAYKLSQDNASYALYVAQITREKAFGLFQESRYERDNAESQERVNKMNAESLSLYMKMIGSGKTDANTLGRSAFGMVKLPEPYRRIDLAVQAIEKALELSPDNPLVNHYAGLIYYRHVKDNFNGLKYLERAAKLKNFPAMLDWIKLKYIVDPRYYDPIPELTNALQYEDYASTTLTDMSSWYFFIKDDVFRAWDHLKKVTDDHFAKNHKSPYLRMKHPCNLFEVIFDEVKLLIAKDKYSNQEEKEKLISISKELQAICPQSHPTDYSNFKAVILNESDRLTKNDQTRLYGRGGGGGDARAGSALYRARESSSNARGDFSGTRGGSSNGRGRSFNNRGGPSNFRRGSNGRGGSSNSTGRHSNDRGDKNIEKKANQTGMNIALGEKPPNPERDSRSRGRGKSNRGQGKPNRGRIGPPQGSAGSGASIDSEQNNNYPVPDVVGGISLKDVLTEKLIGLNSDFKNNLNVTVGNNLDSSADGGEASCSRKKFTQKNKPKNHGQQKRQNENDSSNRKCDNLEKMFLNVYEKPDDETNHYNCLGASASEDMDKTPKDAFFKRKPSRPPRNNNFASQNPISGSSNITSKVNCDNLGINSMQKPSNLDKLANDLNVTNDFSGSSGKRPPRQDKRPLYFPKDGSQSTNFTTNTF
ncbi:hypothetical protein LSTR_LSTR000972 [Laodelphax striatellus]|uniref:Uncharacterized protein n=1 Tax=Laodelphax striatellus TaxID=195883 RepID=A0A482X2I5_LAOST|nr:hypothetical protein LSTR_LSTR000972 [Laodelphax striatellus]